MGELSKLFGWFGLLCLLGFTFYCIYPEATVRWFVREAADIEFEPECRKAAECMGVEVHFRPRREYGQPKDMEGPYGCFLLKGDYQRQFHIYELRGAVRTCQMMKMRSPGGWRDVF